MLTIFPPKNKFLGDVQAGRISPLYTELPFQEPQHYYQKLKRPYSFIFESFNGPERIARYSFIGCDPFLIYKVKNGAVSIVSHAGQKVSADPPLAGLRKILSSYRIEPIAGLPPFVGGAAGMISYDFVHYFESLPRTAADDLHIPDAHFLLIDTVIAFDHTLGKTYLISCPGAEETIEGTEGNWADYYEHACEKIQGFYRKLNQKEEDTGRNTDRVKSPITIVHEMEKKQYMDMVIKAKEYIRAGDIFQANLSQRVSAKIGDRSPWHVYKTLSTINPSPFAAYLDMGDYYIASSSPERLVRVRDDVVETRPIAGTRPRGVNADDDKKLRADLLLNEKERAEHLMLIDLERNDLGRISDYSSVEVDEFMTTEDYSHVIHIVSNVKGKLAKGKDSFDAIRAVFPGGTITGVPKVRCMEIIDELEPVVRGPYTGSVGYISFSGAMDLNIIIRTFVIKNKTAYVQAGAGIVADSEPEKEHYESLKKAEALIRTLEVL
ncbi:MAG: anthranilate synthase component I family protein [Nitrospiraceae bacterium]|nr:MAG: anthranilate synthase component I family protein [Nitrospiraceae bacterium]